MTLPLETPIAHHLGYAVRDADAAARRYERMLDATFRLMPPYELTDLYGNPAKLKVYYGAIGQQVSRLGAEQIGLLFGLAFLIVGVAFKFGAAPFHMWVPDVYHGAPTPVTLFLGSAPKIAAFGMAYRLLEGGLSNLVDDWQQMLAFLAVASLAIGNIVAIAQTNLKRMLAYSTISHVGFLLLGLLNGTPEGYAAAMFYAITYALTATASFGMIVLLSKAGFEADEIDQVHPLADVDRLEIRGDPEHQEHVQEVRADHAADRERRVPARRRDQRPDQLRQRRPERDHR